MYVCMYDRELLRDHWLDYVHIFRKEAPNTWDGHNLYLEKNPLISF